MNNRFFESALAAAHISPEALALEFQKPDANANVKYHNPKTSSGLDLRDTKEFHDTPLMQAIIKKLPDDKLPAILDVLLLNGLDKEIFKNTALRFAVTYNKEKTVDFLIKNQATINMGKDSPLIKAINQAENLKIIDALLEAKADINIRDIFDQTPLMKATQQTFFKIIQHLLSKNADLFSSCNDDYNRYKACFNKKTALSFAYTNTVYSRRGGDDPQTIHEKACLDLLIEALAAYLYQQGLKESNEELFIANTIDKAIGDFDDPSKGQCSADLKKQIEERIQPNVLATRLKNEKQDAFCAGEKKQQENTPINNFFGNDGKKDITNHIFSYVNAAPKTKK